MRALQLAEYGGPALAGISAAAELVETFLASMSERTRQEYRRDLEDFAAYCGVATIDQAANQLLSWPSGTANHVALQYRTMLIERGLAPATINRRLAALRSLVKLGRVLGMIPWTLEVPGVKAETYRDTRGPGVGAIREMLRAAEARGDAKGQRDAAIIRLLFDLALRRSEVVGLDLEHLDLERGTVAVLGKGRKQRRPVTLPEATREALSRWVEVRGQEPGPLFGNFDRAGKGQGRLSGQAVYHVVSKLGREVGARARPHGLRHSAITAALDKTNGNLRAAQKFARHADPATTCLYDDSRRDTAGEVATLVSLGL